jgi:hypothetical protein
MDISATVLYALKIIYSSSTFFVGLAAVFAYLLKDRQSFNFALITFFFFIIGMTFHFVIKEVDRGIFIYRYIFWAFNDIAWMGVIAYLTIKDKIHLWQSILGQLIVLPAPLLQLVRLVDRHYFDLSYTNYLYVTILPMINTAVVVLCFAPLFVIFTQYLKNKKAQEEVEA